MRILEDEGLKGEEKVKQEEEGTEEVSKGFEEIKGFKEMSLDFFRCLLLLALPLLRGGVAQERCSEDDELDVIDEWRNCTDEFKEEYAVAKERAQHQAEVNVAICRMLQGLVEECGNLWARCRSDEEVRTMKDNMMASLMRKNSGSEDSLADCPIVIRFRLIEEEPEELCTQNELQEAQAKFQNCSHQITTSLVDQQEKTGGIGECPGLQPIRQKCSPALLQCMRTDEAERVLEVHLEQVAARWPVLVDCAAEQREESGDQVVGAAGSKVERDALDEGGEAVGDVKEEKKDEGGGGKSEIWFVSSQENATGREEERLSRQKATEIGKAGEQHALKGGGGVKNAHRGGGAVEQSPLQVGGVEQSALRGGGEGRQGAAVLVLAATLCYHLFL